MNHYPVVHLGIFQKVVSKLFDKLANEVKFVWCPPLFSLIWLNICMKADGSSGKNKITVLLPLPWGVNTDGILPNALTDTPSWTRLCSSIYFQVYVNSGMWKYCWNLLLAGNRISSPKVLNTQSSHGFQILQLLLKYYLSRREMNLPFF